jgi:hypothetical protein
MAIFMDLSILIKIYVSAACTVLFDHFIIFGCLKISRENYMKLYQVLAWPIGGLLFVIAMLMRQFLSSNHTLDFIIGMLMGISAVFNIYYIIVTVRNAKKQ